MFLYIPECFLIWCFFKQGLFLKNFEHVAHWNGFSTVCDFIWTSKERFLLKPLLHNAQKWERAETHSNWKIYWFLTIKLKLDNIEDHRMCFK